jgi:hypothetical protein
MSGLCCKITIEVFSLEVVSYVDSKDMHLSRGCLLVGGRNA